MTDAAPPWSDGENDLTVAAYFEMLQDELSGRAYVKAARNRALQTLVSRGHKAIEFKHQNISAVLLGMGLPWIDGYKPASNFQMSLVDAVMRWLAFHPGWAPESLGTSSGNAVREDASLWIGPPPTHANEPPQVDLDRMAGVAAYCDAAGRDDRNRALGKSGEALVLSHERKSLRAVGRSDLADRVNWVSEREGDGAGYDIASFEPDGTPRLVEVKTTNGWERTPFHISRNELAVAETNRDTWHLVRLWNFAREPRAFSLRPPLERHVSLTPTSFLASLN